MSELDRKLKSIKKEFVIECSDLLVLSDYIRSNIVLASSHLGSLRYIDEFNQYIPQLVNRTQALLPVTDECMLLKSMMIKWVENTVLSASLIMEAYSYNLENDGQMADLKLNEYRHNHSLSRGFHKEILEVINQIR